MRGKLAVAVTAVVVLWLAACNQDALVLYETGTGGQAGATTTVTTGGSGGANPVMVQCQPQDKGPCFCPKGANCSCNPNATSSCSIDCPEGYCGLDCHPASNCELWCGEGCDFVCPAGATCTVKCIGGCTLECSENATCTIYSYKYASEVECMENANCNCPKGSFCECSGKGC